MSDVVAAMALLQFGDSFFPSGAWLSPGGWKALRRTRSMTDAGGCTPLSSASSMRAGLGSIEPSSAWRVEQMRVEAVAAIDEQVEIRTPCAELRSGSRRTGEAMLAVLARLGIGGVPAYRALIKRGVAYGHVAPMQGVLWGRAGLSGATRHRLVRARILYRAIGRRPPARLPHAYRSAAHHDRGQARGVRLASCRAFTRRTEALGCEAEIAVMGHVNSSTRVFAN